MVTLHLLVALVVVVTSDGALSNENLECAYKEGSFCFHAKRAYEQNNKAIQCLNPDLFEGDKERLSNTNSAIANVLKVENKSELFERLREPMQQEVNALSQLMGSCIVGGRELPQCGDALVYVTFATYELAQAIAEVADGSQKDAIKNARDKFKNDLYTEGLNKSAFQLAHELGTAVLNAF